MTTRHPAVAGLFYPASPNTLAADIAKYMANAQKRLPAVDGPEPKALLVPHAGYIYSGQMAAEGYLRLATAKGQIRRAVILGPAHRVPVRGLALPESNIFATPLGNLPVAKVEPGLLARLPQLRCDETAHLDEHSIEVQLPFIQTLLGAVEIVPLAVGAASTAEVAEVIDALWGGSETVIIISSDLSHYLPYGRAVTTDEQTIERILTFDSAIPHDRACGANCLNGMLLAAEQRQLRPELIGRCTSGDTAGDKDRVVGYCSVAFYQPAAGRLRLTDSPGHEQTQSENQLPPNAGEVLLPLARQAIAQAISAIPPPSPAGSQAHPAWLDTPGACFVTLTEDGQLRGCIGSLQANRPLSRDLIDNAVAAAISDPRFPPLTPEELPQVTIEVSVLTTPQQIVASSEDEILAALRPGVDGVILRSGGRQATFLPQVWEQLPEPRQFLTRLKRKAGLPDDYWDEKTVVESYQVRAWEEP